tara:strand:- start:50 stop:415 length:366 start_codon:yes stop_codon:yes gene_type:complete
MNLNRRRPFRSRQHKNGFRRKNSSTSLQTGKLNYSNGNSNFRRNENISSPAGLEKTISKFEQLAKDAQRSGDNVLYQSYLQYADHYSRKLADVNYKNEYLKKDSKNQSELSPEIKTEENSK